MEVQWTTKWSWNTVFSADSVEWCPIEEFTDIMVCGTYQLKENDESNAVQKRIGRIYLFTIKGDDKTEPIQTVETSGILDQKWCQHKINDTPVLATATSIGTLQLYQLLKNENSLYLKLWNEATIGENILALSLDWSSNKCFHNTPFLLVSDSSGNVTMFSLDDGKLVKVGVWKVHGYEAWITAFNYWNTDIFYSGGDDCLLKTIDKRVSDSTVATNKSHEAGVTAIRCHTEVEHQIITGSYDEKVRLFDTRNTARPLGQLAVKGGVWRLKWHPQKQNIILTACMYGGFRILNLLDNNFSIISEYGDHESIAYGADWCREGSMVGTCSFYDCKLNISEVVFK